MNHRLKAMDDMDACVFSSDMLYNDEERAEFKAMVARWTKALNETESAATPQRDFVGLTDDEIRNEANHHVFDESFFNGAVWARGKIKEKNNG